MTCKYLYTYIFPKMDRIYIFTLPFLYTYIRQLFKDRSWSVLLDWALTWYIKNCCDENMNFHVSWTYRSLSSILSASDLIYVKLMQSWLRCPWIYSTCLKAGCHPWTPFFTSERTVFIWIKVALKQCYAIFDIKCLPKRKLQQNSNLEKIKT